jgi:hypothetical protein
MRGTDTFVPSDQQQEAWQRFQEDSLEIPDPATTVVRPCRSSRCRLPVWDGTTRASEKECAFDVRPDGTPTRTNHWRTCLDRPAFRRK